MGVAIKIENAVKKFGKETIIKELSLDIRPGEFFTLLGPSGCGKTTLLRMIIGFNTIEGGLISVDGKVINEVPTSKRNMGMVFQNYAIFPHMSVKDNVGYGLKTRHVPSAEKAAKVAEILKITKIDTYADRMPAQLSGGQQQRVALARAIVISPDVLLMDEPLSNLDAKLRIEMRNAIKKIQRQLGITTVYVTHDQEEALAVSDRIAVMSGGEIQQIGTPKHVYQRPSNLFVATFIGLSNIIDGSVKRADGRAFVEIGAKEPVEVTTLRDDARGGQPVFVSVRPEEFIIDREGLGIPVTVRQSIFLGVNLHYFVEDANGKEMEVIQPSELSEIIPDGAKIFLSVHPHKINIYDRESRLTLVREDL